MQVIITVNLPIGFNFGKNEDNKCYRKIVIEDSVVSYQMNRSTDDRPEWVENPKVWKKMSPLDKLKAFVDRFDDGWGVSFECVE